MSEDVKIKATTKDLLKSGVLFGADSLVEHAPQVISVSPAADIGLSGGIPGGSWVNFSGDEKCGKAQPLDSIVYTPNGKTRIRDIKVNDTICSPFNKTSRVVGVYPQGNKEVYKITFLDGDSTICCKDHLWEVIQVGSINTQVLPTEELLHNTKTTKGKNRWYVRVTNPVEFISKSKLLIDPYVMGCLLGDGGMSTKSLVLTNSDQELLDKVQSRLIEGYYLSKKSDYDYLVTRGKTGGQSNYYIDTLKKYGLYGCKSYSKFIPEEYLYSSIDDRWQLLQGLMDTDGTISKRGHASYSTVSLELAQDIKELVNSLGGLVKVQPRLTTYITSWGLKVERKSYRLHIRFSDKTKLFSLSRKLDRVKDRTKPDIKRTISNIEYMGTTECACIKVDNDDGLYLTNDFIVTHNTTLALHIVAKAQKLGRPTFHIDVEHRLKKMHLTGIKGLKLAKDNNDYSGLQVMRSNRDKILVAEEILTGTVNIAKEHPGAVIIIDSVSALCASGEMNSSITGKGRALGPRMMAEFCREMASIVPVNDCIVISIMHMIANTSGYGAAKMEDSGRKIQYQGDVKLRCKNVEKWEDGGKQVGQYPNWQVLFSALGAPGAMIRSSLRYGIGIDEASELIDVGLDFGIIEQAGAWYSLTSLIQSDHEAVKDFCGDKEPEKALKAQGRAAIYQVLVDNPVFQELIYAEIKNML